MLASLSFAFLFVATTVATFPQSTRAQADCAALNAAKGEGKFAGQISSPPDGSSMNITYADQSVLVHYNSSVTVCQGGQPASVNALTRGASVVVLVRCGATGKIWKSTPPGSSSLAALAGRQQRRGPVQNRQCPMPNKHNR
jgi:hypothetical protein